jgi:taurine dioxygenase
MSLQQEIPGRGVAPPGRALHFERLGEVAGIAALGIDLNQEADAATAASLRRALLDNLVLCIRGQNLAPAVYRDALRIFGTPMIQLAERARHKEIAEIQVLSSEDRDVHGDGQRIVVGAAWHTDDSFKAVPCSLTVLYGVEVPASGGDTQFVNMYRPYEDLPAETQARIVNLRVIHKYDSSRKGNRVAKRTAAEEAQTPDVVHPLVRTHPETGRKALYLNPNRMEQIVGMERDESDRLLDELIAHATQPKYQYRHKWQNGDIVVWDNRCTMHKANADYPEGSRRFMHRLIMEGTVPV